MSLSPSAKIKIVDSNAQNATSCPVISKLLDSVWILNSSVTGKHNRENENPSSPDCAEPHDLPMSGSDEIGH